VSDPEPTPEQPTQQAAVPTETVADFPDPGGFQWALVADGFERPLDLVDLGDRLLVLEQAGVIRVVQNNTILEAPFLDLLDRVGSNGNERGLLGIALHPGFEANRLFYLNYTDKAGNSVISRFTAAADLSAADPGSEAILLQVEQPYANHNGGVIAFGPDGFLYVGLGDGGSAGDPQGNGQSLDTLLGKVLRIDVEGDPYAIPPTNPFANGGGRPEIFAYGLRNPWRFSFDRLTGDLYIADVGQNAWEEINFFPAGTPGGINFGWNYREGRHAYQGNPPADVQLVDPVAEYPHSEGCSVTGGYVYRGQTMPEFRGVYLYIDYCSGKLWGLLRDGSGAWISRELFQTGFAVTSFGQDRLGELYMTDQKNGALYRLERQ
jgi:glucose/arabinose dehydrogenase